MEKFHQHNPDFFRWTESLSEPYKQLVHFTAIVSVFSAKGSLIKALNPESCYSVSDLLL